MRESRQALNKLFYLISILGKSYGIIVLLRNRNQGYSTAKKTESGGIAEIGSYCSCLSDPITFTVTLDICYHFILFFSWYLVLNHLKCNNTIE